MIFRVKEVKEVESDGGILFVHSFILDKADMTNKAAIFEVAASVRLPWKVTEKYELDPVEVSNANQAPKP